MSEFVTHDADETRALGERLGRTLAAGATVALVGELGAGKTAFVQGLARGLGIAGTISSPTFTIVKEHDGPIPLFHVDFYRLEDARELAAIGFDDYFERGGVVVVEWADRFFGALPADRIEVRIEIAGADERRVRIDSAVK
ncbi:MAG TPA: tRNA (adenosine(37)-N6)-threonylcarbamoyltransferase complex ATPase subunit type 1 TsaE [Polyangia bacterium]